MPNVVLFVIDEPEPNTRAVLYSGAEKPHPLIVGDGDVNLLCGGCGFVIVETVIAGQIQGPGCLQCPRCKAFNETRT